MELDGSKEALIIRDRNVMDKADRLENKIKALGDSPGVYIFKDSSGKILYIGKAKSLKKRVRSYFTRDLSAKTQALVAKIADIEYALTPNESQAQILEASLIKDRQPPYNITLKDDKSFPWIKISNEEFPVISVCRKKKQKEDNGLYFGPYTNPRLLRQAIKLIRRVFGFRSCKKMPKDTCLYYRLSLCPAPCAGKISHRKYREIINNIVMFLDSRYEELLKHLAARMQEASLLQRFEEASKIRDQINALSIIGQGKPGVNTLTGIEGLQRLLKLNRPPNRIEAFDISNISGQQACGSMVSFYNGIPDKENYRRFRIKTVGSIDDYGMLQEVLRRRYNRLIKENAVLPDLILIDGGKSHILTAYRITKELGIDIPIVGIAKEKENIYTINQGYPLKLEEGSAALNLIRRIRDEAHRFAVVYHRVLRRKSIIGR